MAEETKQAEKKAESKNMFGAFIKIIIGLVLLAIAAYLLIGRHWWGYYTWPLIKGCAAPFLILAGIITLAIAKE
ncbi:MAG: hypothetical protein PHN57_01900 [Candidatus Omnitrophica bacterium]|nr:hypothetical protein [Candidatus Omnitrophota bacterium]